MSSLTSRQFPQGFPIQVGVSGTTNGGPLLVAVPTSPTDLTTKDSYVFQVSLTNGTAGDIAFTLSDKQASPVAAMSTTTITSHTTISFTWDEGLFFKGGITWSASGAGLTGSVVAFSNA